MNLLEKFKAFFRSPTNDGSLLGDGKNIDKYTLEELYDVLEAIRRYCVKRNIDYMYAKEWHMVVTEILLRNRKK